MVTLVLVLDCGGMCCLCESKPRYFIEFALIVSRGFSYFSLNSFVYINTLGYGSRTLSVFSFPVLFVSPNTLMFSIFVFEL
jgi:hypothetical protein